MGNYLSDSGPNFKAGEVKLNSIPEYQYNKDMKKELKAGHVKKEDLAELYALAIELFHYITSSSVCQELF